MRAVARARAARGSGFARAGFAVRAELVTRESSEVGVGAAFYIQAQTSNLGTPGRDDLPLYYDRARARSPKSYIRPYPSIEQLAIVSGMLHMAAMQLGGLLVLLPVGVAAHGAIVSPRSRNSIDFLVPITGIDNCRNLTGAPCQNGQAAHWYSQG